MSVIDGIKILNEQEQEEIRKQLIADKEKECQDFNGQENISMEEIIDEIKAYRKGL